RSALEVICRRYPEELLSYLFSTGSETFEFDSIHHTRFGGGPAWMQEAEFPNCPVCKKKMQMVLQLPESMLPWKQSKGSNFYFFACPTHADQMRTIEQCT